MSHIDGYYKDFNDPAYEALNREINGLLSDLPFFYQIPPELFSAGIPSGDATPFFDFRHALSRTSAENALGLRLYLMPPEANPHRVSRYLAQSGLVKTGDILLSFRQGTTGTGEYQHLQLGLTHTGFALVRDGALYNLDSPLSFSGQLDQDHYTEDQLMLHVLRPGLSDDERRNLQQWAELLFDNRGQLAARIAFASDYGAPKSARGHEKEVFNLGRLIASGGARGESTGMYCSEFVWHLLALRGCDIGDAAVRRQFLEGDHRSFNGSLDPLFAPMPVLGTALLDPEHGSPGLSDGVGLILNSLEVSPAELDQLLDQAFAHWDPHFSGGRPPYAISAGHRQQAAKFEPLYDPLKAYFRAVKLDPPAAGQIKAGIDAQTRGQENYSPTAYLVQALLPESSMLGRVVSYVGTLSFPTPLQQALLEQQFPRQLAYMHSLRPAALGRVPEVVAVQYEDGYRGGRFFKRDQVKTLQCMLNLGGAALGEPDGLYGNGTTRAVRAYLASLGIEADGRALSWSQWEALEARAGERCGQYGRFSPEGGPPTA
ncbi:peptidoglycan-binding domain-containing protein [Thiocystis violacea]|uniref:peptidoglycan-binding domain-containing protein n=1 Tax=Thiocystis violacea TaxID=13725 RepID=UPI001902D52F|nr:peptidoglycan-binding domain-containing protein [Thiocystis violacea]MBK1721738.1 hypothetical protein [Thiocystis violacea]